MSKQMSTWQGAKNERGGIGRVAKWLALLIAAAVLLALPLATNDYIQYVLNLMLVTALAAVGFNIVLGYLGQLAFANTAFFGIGAYALGILMERGGLPFWAALLPAGLAGAIVGLLVGLPALRLKGYYLAIVTLAFGELMRWSYIHADAYTHGSSGLAVAAPRFGGLVLETQAQRWYLLLGVTVLVMWGVANLLRSRIGRAWVSIRENEFAASSLGYWPARYKVGAFAASGFVTGISGALFAALIGRIAPDSFGLNQLLTQFAVVMIGGMSSLWGAVLGAVLLTAAPELLRNFPGAEEIVFSLLLIGVLIFMPRGLAGMLTRHVPRLRERLYLGSPAFDGGKLSSHADTIAGRAAPSRFNSPAKNADPDIDSPPKDADHGAA